jgi:aspartate carbamoyltransferase catalytic subunit
MKRDLLGLKGVSAAEIDAILKSASLMKYNLLHQNKKAPHLQGKSVITLFYENSTRTRLSFEMAGKYLGAAVANISASSSSVQKGETLIDTVKTIDAMAADVIVIRHPMGGAPALAAKHTKAAIVNAGDGMNEHPTQALLDMFTIKEKKGRIDGLKVAILGDIAHSRVARSNIYGLKTMGAEISVGGPSTLMPPDIGKLGVSVFNSVQEAMIDADVVIGLRLQLERQKSGLFPSMREYSRFFGVDDRRLRFAKPDALVLHPGPVNRGVEYTSSVIDGEQSCINEQVTNGVAVRMAILNILTGRNLQDADLN